MQFVLDYGEKLFGHRRVFIIICRENVYIGNLLVKAPLTGPDFPDTLQEFIKIILAENLIALFEPFIIQNKAFDNEFFQDSGSPDAKLCGLVGVYAITDRDYSVEIRVELLEFFE